jgi:hypothetical protein
MEQEKQPREYSLLVIDGNLGRGIRLDLKSLYTSPADIYYQVSQRLEEQLEPRTK